MSKQPTSREYVLGTGSDEVERLAFQHRLWADAAHAAWRLARIGVGQRVLDIGCGPGFAAFDLAQLVTAAGRVVGVDESAAYIAHLTEQAKARQLPQLRGLVGDVMNLAGMDLREALREESPEGSSDAWEDSATGSAGRHVPPYGVFDLAWARWVLCFVPDPRAVVAGAAALLRPGGRFVVHDYFNYGSMTTAPRRVSHDRAVEATIRSWRARGGDPDVVGRLPGLLDRAGLDVVHIAAHCRVARPGETMFQWPAKWWRIYAPKLVAMGYLPQESCDELLADLNEIEASRTDFIQCPPVYEVVAVKR